MQSSVDHIQSDDQRCEADHANYDGYKADPAEPTTVSFELAGADSRHERRLPEVAAVVQQA